MRVRISKMMKFRFKLEFERLKKMNEKENIITNAALF